MRNSGSEERLCLRLAFSGRHSGPGPTLIDR